MTKEELVKKYGAGLPDMIQIASKMATGMYDAGKQEQKDAGEFLMELRRDLLKMLAEDSRHEG